MSVLKVLAVRLAVPLVLPAGQQRWWLVGPAGHTGKGPGPGQPALE